MTDEMLAVEYEQYMQHATMAQSCPQMPDGKPWKVWVAEAAYCSDTMYEDKLKEKELQHKHLQEALSALGYEVIAYLSYLDSMAQPSQQPCSQLKRLESNV